MVFDSCHDYGTDWRKPIAILVVCLKKVVLALAATESVKSLASFCEAADVERICKSNCFLSFLWIFAAPSLSLGKF